MPLTDQQLLSLDALEWLFSTTARRSGRTTVLAIAAIRWACRNPGQQVFLFDHVGDTNHLRRNLAQIIRRLVESDDRLRRHLEMRREEMFWLDLAWPIEDWLPQEDMFSGILSNVPAARAPSGPYHVQDGDRSSLPIMASLWAAEPVVSPSPLTRRPITGFEKPPEPVRRSVWERLNDD
jgi:hypothetical protein